MGVSPILESYPLYNKVTLLQKPFDTANPSRTRFGTDVFTQDRGGLVLCRHPLLKKNSSCTTFKNPKQRINKNKITKSKRTLFLFYLFLIRNAEDGGSKRPWVTSLSVSCGSLSW